MKLQNKCDIHTHTVFSGHAYSTIRENVLDAADAGMEVLGTADHFSAMLFPDWKSAKNYQYIMGLKDWPRTWKGVTLLRGVEADIVDAEGHLFGEDVVFREGITGDRRSGRREESLYTWCTRRLDYVIASVHGKDFTDSMTQAQITRMYLTSMERPEVLMLGHIGRTGLSFDLDEILHAALSLKKPIEINEHSWAFGDRAVIGRCRKIAERCAELGVQIAVTTDAHISCNAGRFDQSLDMLEEIHFPQELIATRDRKSLLAMMREALPGARLDGIEA
ncbi:MAG: phosphatase [Lachnospiraceae bacterium]|nr:phosphatase [Lachnospiraceae bacterium]